MGLDRLGDDDDGSAASPRAVDAGLDEGDLEAPDRGDGGAAGVLLELQSDQARAPGGMLALEVAGDAEQLLSRRRDWAAVAAIAGGKSVEPMPAEQAPDLTDRAVGDRQVGRDLGQWDALLMASHDLLAERDGDGARHASGLREPAIKDYRLTKAYVTHVDKQRHELLRISWCQPYCA
jgi:hypothetical protein